MQGHGKAFSVEAVLRRILAYFPWSSYASCRHQGHI